MLLGLLQNILKRQVATRRRALLSRVLLQSKPWSTRTWSTARARRALLKKKHLMWMHTIGREALLPAQRIAADGMPYTYTKFLNHYGAGAEKKWEEVAATEHSYSRTPQHLLPAQRFAADGMPYTYTKFLKHYGAGAKKK